MRNGERARGTKQLNCGAGRIENYRVLPPLPEPLERRRGAGQPSVPFDPPISESDWPPGGGGKMEVSLAVAGVPLGLLWPLGWSPRSPPLRGAVGLVGTQGGRCLLATGQQELKGRKELRGLQSAPGVSTPGVAREREIILYKGAQKLRPSGRSGRLVGGVGLAVGLVHLWRVGNCDMRIRRWGGTLVSGSSVLRVAGYKERG